MKMSLNEIQEARVNKIEKILILEKNKLIKLKELSAIREKAIIVGEMKEIENNLEEIEMKRINMENDLKMKKHDLLEKLHKLQELQSPDNESKKNGHQTDDEDGDPWMSEEDEESQYLRGRKNRERLKVESKLLKSPSSNYSSVDNKANNNAVKEYYNTYGSAENPSYKEETEVSISVLCLFF